MRCRFLCLALFLIVALALVAQAPTQEKEHPVATQVKANLKDPTKPFTIFVHVKVKGGAGPKFETAFAKAIVETRKEKGSKAYDLNRSVKAPNEYVVYERWTNLAALQAHLQTPHITTLFAEIGDLIEGPPDAKVLLPAGE